jgi:hypothetical protein
VTRRLASVVVVATLVVVPQPATAQSPTGKLAGMWSDPPVTILGNFCAAWCTDAGIQRLNALLDDPANDKRPLPQLLAEAGTYQRETYLRPRLTAAALETFPLDPADDPGLLGCEPWGLARQMLSRHQIEIRQLGKDRIELHYGEWDARRVVFMDGRRPAGQTPTRFGHSVGHWDGDTLVVETSGVAADRTSWLAKHSDQLHAVERFTRSADGQTLNLTATFEDPWSLRQPVVVKRLWRWAPTSQIAPYKDCEPPISVKKGVGQ